MRRGLALLILCVGLAALFVSAARTPAPRLVVITQVGDLIAFPTSCAPTPLGINCKSHAQAERLRARFARYHLSLPVAGKTVALSVPISAPTLPAAP